MNYCYKFPVVRGVQAKKEYYIAMVPLKMLSRLFPNDDEFVLPEHRAQRRINEARIPEIKNYILDNLDTYVFSALAASIDGEYNFIPNVDGNTGILEVSMDARFLINDGQHRKTAIIAAIEENSIIEEETISVVFFEDQGLIRSQQMFTDLNKHAIKTSNSISELYDSRDALAVATRKIVSSVDFFEEFVDKERDILGKYSSSLFTLNNIYTANKRILSRNKCDERFVNYAIAYWNTVANHMIPWKNMISKEISKTELREQYIVAQSVVLQALGRIGAFLFNQINIEDLDMYIKKIEKINWKRNAKCWKLRVIKNNGRMINNERAIILAANVIKKEIGIDLSDDEITIEKNFIDV